MMATRADARVDDADKDELSSLSLLLSNADNDADARVDDADKDKLLSLSLLLSTTTTLTTGMGTHRLHSQRPPLPLPMLSSSSSIFLMNAKMKIKSPPQSPARSRLLSGDVPWVLLSRPPQEGTGGVSFREQILTKWWLKGGGGKDEQLGNGGGGNISEGGEMVRTNKAIGRGLPNSRGVRAGERDRSLLLLYVVRPSKLGWVR